jgi:hypothetical protein
MVLFPRSGDVAVVKERKLSVVPEL